MHDGSRLRIRKLGRDYDPTNKLGAHRRRSNEAEAKDEVLTGLLYVNTEKPTFLDMLNMVDEPLATLPDARVRPSPETLEQIMEELR